MPFFQPNHSRHGWRTRLTIGFSIIAVVFSIAMIQFEFSRLTADPKEPPLTSPSPGQPNDDRIIRLAIQFPDPEFRECVTNELGLSRDEVTVPQWALDSILNLNCTSRTITDLAGVESLRKIESILLSGRTLKDLTPLTDAKTLSMVGLFDTNVTELKPITELPSLTSFDISDQPLTNPMIQSLAKAQDLFSLRIVRSQVDLSELAILPHLSQLELTDLPNSNLPELSNVKNLDYLTLHEFDDQDLSWLKDLPLLYCLDISGSKFSDASFALPLSELSCLDISYTQIKSIAPLLECPSLHVIGLVPEEIDDFYLLQDNPKIDVVPYPDID